MRAVWLSVLVLCVAMVAGCVEDTDAEHGAAELAAAPARDWAVQIGGTRNACHPTYGYMCWDLAQGGAVVGTADGGAVLGGSLQGTASFGALTVSATPWSGSYPSTDIVVARIDASGAFTWARAFGGSNNDWLYDLVLDKQGNIYLTGTFATPVTIGTTTLTSLGSVDFFVAKLDTAGNPLWAVSGGSAGYDVPRRLALEKSTVALVANTRGDVRFGGHLASGLGGSDVFVATIDTGTGAVTSAANYGGAGNEHVRDAHYGPNGALLVAGGFEGSTSLVGVPLESAGGADIFVASLFPGAWVVTGGGTGWDIANALATDSGGNIFVGGSFQGQMTWAGDTIGAFGGTDGFVLKLDAAGRFVWGTPLGGVGGDSVADVKSDGSSAFAVGTFSETASFGAATLSSQGATDAFLVALDRDGLVVAAEGAGGGAAAVARSLDVRATAAVWVTGNFVSSATFAKQTLTSRGVVDAFVWKRRITK